MSLASQEITLTRKELYDLVWASPLTTLAKKYLISDVGLRKICNRMAVPLPKSGHWHKLKFGKKVPIVGLPDDKSIQDIITLSLRGENQEKVKPTSPVEKLKLEIEEMKGLTLLVPSKLHNPDSLIITAKEHLESRKRDYLHHGLLKSRSEYLDITVAPTNISRSLLFLDTFIKALKSRGHKIIIRDGNTHALIDQEEIRISFREKLNRVVVKGKYYDSSEYHPSGILIFKLDVYPETEWKDGKEPIETMISKILAKLELKSKAIKEDREHWRKITEERDKKLVIEKEAELRRENELSQFKELIQKANRWNQAKTLKEYLKAVKHKAVIDGLLLEDLKHWLTWAENKIDWFDPLLEKVDVIFTDVDKDTLTFKKRTGFW
jgi:hypothetical protein